MAFEGRYRETQRGGFGSGAASAEPTENGAASTLQELESDLGKFQECIDSVGTPLDSHTNRAEIKRLRSVIKSKVTSTKSGLKSGKKSLSPQEKIRSDRQAAQLDGQITKFQRLLDKERTAVKQNPHPGSDETQTVTSRDDMMSPQSQVSQMQRMGGLEEREQEREELHQLEADIVDLRDIQQDMAQMVGEQGQDINAIEKNVAHAAVRVEVGGKQVKTAVELKRKGYKLKFFIAAIITVAVVVLVVILAILLGVLIPKGDN